MLFTADLRSFADRLAATKKVDVSVKEENSEIEIKTEVTTAVALTAPNEEAVDVNIETKPATKATRGKKRKQSVEDIIHTSQTAETRRVSKRLRR